MGRSPSVASALLAAVTVLAACSAGDDDTATPLTLPEPDEVNREFAACYTRNGLDATFEPGAGVAIDVGSEAAAADVQRIVDACEQELIDEGLIFAPGAEPPEVLRLYYEVHKGVFDCLRSNGFLTPDLPSEQVFIEDPDAMPSPYAAIDDRDLGGALAVCSYE